MSTDEATRRRRARTAGAVLVVAALAAGGAWLLFGGGAERVAALFGEGATENGGRPPTPVAIVEATTGAARETFETSGRVRAASDVALTVETAGRVAEILVADGAEVAEGETLLRLADEDRAAERDAAAARLAEAEADLARARELVAEEVAAESRLEMARAEARTARASLTAAEAALENLTLEAPFAGAVGFVDVSVGDYLTPGETVTRLTSVGDLRVRFALPQRLAEDAAPGTPVVVEQGDRTCGRVAIETLAPAMDPETRSRAAETRAPGGCGLRDGGFVTVSIVVATREGAVFAPQASIRRRGFEAWVYRVEEDGDGLVARRAPVTLGALRPGAVEIREGLEAGARIVGEGAHRVADGDPIRPAEAGGPPGGAEEPDGGADDAGAGMSARAPGDDDA